MSICYPNSGESASLRRTQVGPRTDAACPPSGEDEEEEACRKMTACPQSGEGSAKKLKRALRAEKVPVKERQRALRVEKVSVKKQRALRVEKVLPRN